MSLVNDALKKARMETARGDAAKRNIPYPILGRGEHGTSGIWLAALGVVVLLVGIGGFLLYRAGKQAALREQVVEQVATSGAESAPGARPGNEVATRSRAARPDAQPAPLKAVPSEPSPASAVSDSKTSTPSSARTTEPSASPRPAAPTGDIGASGATRADAPPEMAPLRSADSPLPTRSRPTATSDHQPATQAPDPTGASELSEPLRPAPVTENRATAAAPQEFLQRAEIPGVGTVELGGIAWSGDRPFALVNGRVVRPGDTVSAGLVVDDIQPNTVRLRSDSGTLIFRLK